jgi:hypothetical protein
MPRVRGAVTTTARWFWSLENPWSHCTLTQGEEKGASPSLVATVAHRQPKVSKTSSPRRPDAVGEHLIMFSEPERR